MSLLLVQGPVGKIDYSLSGEAGSYTYTGQAATFKVERNLAGAFGSYAYTGQTATFTVGRQLQGAFGTYTYTGQDATLTYTPGSGGIAYSLSGEFGSYSYTGFDGVFAKTEVIEDQPSNWQADYWKHRTKKQRKEEDDRQRIELGILPPIEKEEAIQAVNEAVQASTELMAGRIEAQNAVAVALQARMEYDDIYRRVYKDAYVAEIVAQLWEEDIRKTKRKKAAILLLLH